MRTRIKILIGRSFIRRPRLIATWILQRFLVRAIVKRYRWGFCRLKQKYKITFWWKFAPKTYIPLLNTRYWVFWYFFVILNKNAATCWNAQGKRERIPLPQSVFYRNQVYLGSDLWVRVSVTDLQTTGYISYTSYTSYRLYTEKVTISTLEDSSWWSQLMQVAPSGGQIWN